MNAHINTFKHITKKHGESVLNAKRNSENSKTKITKLEEDSKFRGD